MSDPSLVILYVNSPTASAVFYSDLLGKAPIENSPTFALFALDSNVKLGLWARHTVEPATTVAGGGSELAFTMDTPDAVRSAHAAWKSRGLVIAQAPTAMDFGYTFVALDPDGHRLRVFAAAPS